MSEPVDRRQLREYHVRNHNRCPNFDVYSSSLAASVTSLRMLPTLKREDPQSSSRDFDKRTQSKSDSHKHSMSRNGQSSEDAVGMRDKFIRETISLARAAAMAGNKYESLKLLGEALHPVMDSSSPMHTDSEGNPRVWKGWRSAIGHSPTDFIGSETSKAITPEIYESQDKLIRDLFNQVFKGTPIERETIVPHGNTTALPVWRTSGG
jgi:hypothetical protein